MAILEGKTALVTGASQSIGFASAKALAIDGATVVIMGRGKKGLAEARAELRRLAPHARVEMFAGDACAEVELKQALTYARAITGSLDILVPTVGGGVMQPILMRDVESVRRELEVNYISVFLMVRHGVPLLKRGGSIVCISTIAVNQAIFGLGMYGAAKAALDRFVRAAAFELGGAGLRINAVRPGMTVAPDMVENPAYRATAEEIPLGRVGMPDDIAGVVRFLAGPESAWVTGQSFSADGGQEQGRQADMMDASFGKEVMDLVRSGQSPSEGTTFPVYASTSLRPPQT